MPKTIVTIVKEGGKCRMKGTTYINNDVNKPWPVNVLWDSREQALKFATAHGYVIKSRTRG